MSKKYLTKNEFRYNTSPNVRRHDGKGHNAYVSGKRGHNYLINTITHSTSFHNEPTYPMTKNPERSRPSKRQSYFSVPRWENERYLKHKSRGTWRIDKKDKVQIRKVNKKYH